jgi:hypothetical protein
MTIKDHMQKSRERSRKKNTIESDWEPTYKSKIALTGPINKSSAKRQATGIRMGSDISFNRELS